MSYVAQVPLALACVTYFHHLLFMQLYSPSSQEQQVDKSIGKRITDFYNYMWLRTKGIDPDTLFDGLSPSLKADVAVALYAEMINKVRPKKHRPKKHSEQINRVGR